MDGHHHLNHSINSVCRQVIRDIREACCHLEVATAVKGTGGGFKGLQAQPPKAPAIQAPLAMSRQMPVREGTWRGRLADHKSLRVTVRLMPFLPIHAF